MSASARRKIVEQYQTIEQLTARVRELEEENARLNGVIESNIDDGIDKIMAMSDEQVSALAGFEGSNPEDKATIARQCMDIAMLRVDLAASQAYAEQLREALTRICFDESCFEASENPDDWPVNVAIEALNKIPTDTSALDAYVAEKVKKYGDEVASQKHCYAEAVTHYEKQLAAAQLNNKRLRDALIATRDDLELRMRLTEDDSLNISNSVLDQMLDAIDIPASTEALDKYVSEKAKEATATQKEYYEGVFQDGSKQIAKAFRQRDLAVDALENCRLLAARHRKKEWAGHIMRFCKDAGLSGLPIRNDSIKESEAK